MDLVVGASCHTPLIVGIHTKISCCFTLALHVVGEFSKGHAVGTCFRQTHTRLPHEEGGPSVRERTPEDNWEPGRYMRESVKRVYL